MRYELNIFNFHFAYSVQYIISFPQIIQVDYNVPSGTVGLTMGSELGSMVPDLVASLQSSL